MAANGQDRLQNMWDAGQLTAPTMVCGAFAAELGLKALLAQHRLLTTTDGHSLLDLTQKLPDDVKVTLAGRLGLSTEDMMRCIASESDAFQQWRYSHEQGAGGTFEFAASLAAAAIVDFHIYPMQAGDAGTGIPVTFAGPRGPLDDGA